jgi:hypothetical protein
MTKRRDMSLFTNIGNASEHVRFIFREKVPRVSSFLTIITIVATATILAAFIYLTLVAKNDKYKAAKKDAAECFVQGANEEIEKREPGETSATTITVDYQAADTFVKLIASTAFVYDPNSSTFVAPSDAIGVSDFPSFHINAESTKISICGPNSKLFISGRYWIQSVAPSSRTAGGIEVPQPVYPVTFNIVNRELRRMFLQKTLFLYYDFTFSP